ncbi:hypothetical protein [Paludibacterium denitrificans]|nr:hypothetical protein [Paludibacterium denitrificans]
MIALAGIRTASLKSNRTSDKGLANNRDKHAPKKHKKKAEPTEDWSDL